MAQVAVLLADGFEEVEAMAIVDILRRADITVVIAGLHTGHIESARHVKVIPDTTIDAIHADNFDMLVLPGGQPGADNLNADQRVKGLVREFHDKGKLTGAICAAPYVLANAGVLEGRQVTAYPTYENRLGNARYMDENVVSDGHILTSKGPGTALQFGIAIVEKLIGRERAEAIKEAMLLQL
ncbi:MAG: DJ-1 family glyoxalase III [Dissulfurispiraceae bacterium]|jgi:4-methyl-5(b-hydroxyethyl)-thiazole monophosphate biosynthesis